MTATNPRLSFSLLWRMMCVESTSDIMAGKIV